VYAVLENSGGYILFGVWIVGMVTLFIRYQGYRTAFLKRLPPFNGVPLSMYGGFGPRGVLLRAMGDRQPDPELERLRLDAWRKYEHFVLWIFGFPVLAAGVAALVLIFLSH
jgi:hypothetical protein